MSTPLTTIGEAARAAGVATSTLRYYDEIGLLPPTDRSGGRRRYGPAAVRRLGVIRRCQQAGFSLEEIRALLNAERGWRPLAEAKLRDLQGRLAELSAARDLVRAALDCGCRSLEGCEWLAGDADPACGPRHVGEAAPAGGSR